MSCRLPNLLRAHRLHLKTEWQQRLEARPPNTSLALPEILVHRMDDTLDQLDSLLHGPPSARWLDRHPPRMGQLREQCRCGLNPLLDYFVTGSAAMTALLSAELSEMEKKSLDRAWHLLAQREIESLCGVCCRICAPALTCPAGTGALQLRDGPCNRSR